MKWASQLIEAHDDDNSGRLDKQELIDWLMKDSNLNVEERELKKKRGGYNPASMQFVEDIAYGLALHVKTGPMSALYSSRRGSEKSGRGEEAKEVEVKEGEVKEVEGAPLRPACTHVRVQVPARQRVGSHHAVGGRPAAQPARVAAQVRGRQRVRIYLRGQIRLLPLHAG